MEFSSICWNITSHCNENCLFCYRDLEDKDSSLERNKAIMRNLIQNGVGKISFVGGEPLLYKELFDLVEYGRSLDSAVQFSITTNAILLVTFDDNGFVLNEELLNRIINVFDWICFPLDAPNEQTQTKMGRNIHHLKRIQVLLEYIRSSKCNIRIKINTVVSDINIDFLIDLNKLLEKYEIDRWKLFKFLPSRGIALLNRSKFEINEEKYKENINELLTISKIRISYNKQYDYLKTYITITSSGFLSVYDGKCYSNVIDMATANSTRVFDFVDHEMHKKRRSDYLSINNREDLYI